MCSATTDIILEGHEPVLPGVAKITLMMPIGGLEEVFPRVLDLYWSPCPFGRHKRCCNLPSLTSCSKMIPQCTTVLSGMSSLLVVLAINTLITPWKVPTNFVWPLKIWLILDLFQHLMYWISEHSIDHLRGYRFRLPSKIPTRSTGVVTVWPEIPPLLKDNLAISLALLLVLFNPFVLVNPIHELAYTVDKFPSQRFP